MSNELGTTAYYTTIGSVRGECGHRHQTIVAAERCRLRDHNGCRNQGGYSDRYVYRVTTDGLRWLAGALAIDEYNRVMGGRA